MWGACVCAPLPSPAPRSLNHVRTHAAVLQIKSYLSGNPPIRLGLSENLILGRRDQRMFASFGGGGGGGGSEAADVVMLDTFNLHDSVDAALFDAERVLQLVPPDGHFALLNYRWAWAGGRGIVVWGVRDLWGVGDVGRARRQRV